MKTLTLNKNTVTTLTLNRPDRHNAFNAQMIEEFIQALEEIEAHEESRCLVLKGMGKSFCAGADLQWMKEMIASTKQDNQQDSFRLSELMHKLKTLSKPTIALVHGNVYGGGVGLVACCDIALAETQTRFCLSEVLLGLIPAIISPYVIEAMGSRVCSRYFQTAETFTTEESLRYGLIHIEYGQGESQAYLDPLTKSLLKGAPHAQKKAKRLIENVKGQPIHLNLRKDLAKQMAEIRVSEEAQERLKIKFS